MKIDVTKYWQTAPPEPSPSLGKWLKKIEAGWSPNRRISGMGYYSAAEWYNVYIWEYFHVLRPAIKKKG